MKQVKHNPALAGPGIMFISAALFGYFGFFTGGLMHTNLLNQFVLFFALLDWTLKGTACGFVLGGLLTLARPVPGNLFYGITGLLSAIFFVLIAVMDIMDKQNAAAATGGFPPGVARPSASIASTVAGAAASTASVAAGSLRNREVRCDGAELNGRRHQGQGKQTGGPQKDQPLI
ncbi:MAG: hypothetical protein IIB54_12765 [Planctomycetes bacterium]|nr:hypothetical protein [Planctomycetota bacterium]